MDSRKKAKEIAREVVAQEATQGRMTEDPRQREAQMARTLILLYAKQKKAGRETPKEPEAPKKKGRKQEARLAATPEGVERLSDALEGSGLSGKEFAEALGVSEATASRYLNEPASIPMNRLFEVAGALGIDWEVLQQLLAGRNPAEVLLPSFFVGEATVPYGTLGLIYAYCALPERDRATLATLAAHLLRTAEESGDADNAAGAEAIAAAADHLAYEPTEAEMAAFGPGGLQLTTTSTDEASGALLQALPEVDRIAHAECEALQDRSFTLIIGS